MKKQIFILSVICIALASCNNNNIYDNLQKESNRSPIISELSKFNDSLLQTQLKTRAGSKRTLDRMSIVVADAVGAYEIGSIGAKIGGFLGHPHVGAGIGALIGGAYSSYKCYNLLNSTRASSVYREYKPLQVAAAYAPALEDSTLVHDNLPTEITLNYSTESKDNIEFGAKHNIIVRNLQTNNFVLDCDVKEFLSQEELDILTSKDFITGYDSVTNRLSNCIINGEIPQNTNKDISSMLMNLFASILETYSDKAEDTEFIINKYLDAVQKTSELSNEEKDNIYRALSVAASSFEFWNGKEIQDEQK